jgi:hypothetical protein
MTTEEIEYACDASQPLDFSRHELEAPELTLKRIFYPFGFPAEVRTNSAEVLEQVGDLWGKFEKQHDMEPIRSDVHVVEGSSTDCPPPPVYRIIMPLLISVADGDNYSIVDLERTRTQISISRAALRHKLYAGGLLGTPVCHIATRYATPVHAGCVALDGRGVLLCGDSGAGKSTLSYACALAGWTYVSDDVSYLLNGGRKRMVTGNCYQVRFRPTAAELFPEIKGLEITPRMAGKPSIELPTAPMHIVCAQTSQVDFMVFLNRRSGGPQKLLPYSKAVARSFMRQVLYGTAGSLARQYEVIERLLTVDVLELHYTELDWAIERLQQLVRVGR